MESRESGFDTVDGSNPPPVLVNTPLFARFYICQVVVFGFLNHQQDGMGFRFFR